MKIFINRRKNMIEIEENKHKLLELKNKIKSLGDSL